MLRGDFAYAAAFSDNCAFPLRAGSPPQLREAVPIPAARDRTLQFSICGSGSAAENLEIRRSHCPTRSHAQPVSAPEGSGTRIGNCLLQKRRLCERHRESAKSPEGESGGPGSGPVDGTVAVPGRESCRCDSVSREGPNLVSTRERGRFLYFGSRLHPNETIFAGKNRLRENVWGTGGFSDRVFVLRTDIVAA